MYNDIKETCSHTQGHDDTNEQKVQSKSGSLVEASLVHYWKQVWFTTGSKSGSLLADIVMYGKMILLFQDTDIICELFDQLKEDADEKVIVTGETQVRYLLVIRNSTLSNDFQ